MDLISRQAAIDAVTKYCIKNDLRELLADIECLPAAVIMCRDCEYGEQDEEGWWYCRDLGCQMGDEDGSGFCADAERRSDE